jgi:hypothetical protein
MNGDRYFDGDAFPEDFFPGMDGTEGEEGHGSFEEQDEVERAFELEEKEINQRILFQTVKTLERSVAGWRYKDLKTQRQMIKEQFEFYQSLILGEALMDEDDLDAEDEED